MVSQFVDISDFQPGIGWSEYKGWAEQGDGISRVAIKSSEGVGFEAATFQDHRAGALNAGIDRLIFYHFGRPDLNSPAAEANWQFQVVGPCRPQDILILDFEVQDPLATSEWAFEWLIQQQQNYGGQLPGIYASLDYISTRLQDTRLAQFPLWLADWQFDPNERPASPWPWSKYDYLQYTDMATNIPGVPGTVDADIFLGGNMIPIGWHDDGTMLTANGHEVVRGFRDYILANQWDPSNVPLENEYGVDPVEDYYTQVPSGGTRQMFRYSELGWTTIRGVYRIGIGNELLGCRQERDSLKSQLAAFKDTKATVDQVIGLLQPLS